MSPKLIGYICQSSAQAFYANGHACIRQLPFGFQALPVAHVTQIGVAEIAKAFRLGASGVLLLGCEVCQAGAQRTLLEAQYADLLRAVMPWGITADRIILAWCAAQEVEKFLALVQTSMARLERLPPLVLPRSIDQTIQHCG